MILRALTRPAEERKGGKSIPASSGSVDLSLAGMHAQYPGESVWTIDVAFILRSFGASVRFLTMYPGINPVYRESEWYKDAIPNDEKRVMKRFAEATRNGIAVEKSETPTAEFLSLMKDNKYFLIVLVDRTQLMCSQCARATPELIARYHEAQKKEDAFIGHFVVVTRITRADSKEVLEPCSKVAVIVNLHYPRRNMILNVNTLYGTLILGSTNLENMSANPV
eukprot:CAMPEP_0114534360 /NCGR_PEP_ID=MMETSP0109-20121206/27795_1 /TAXON_ID=29199 /ORGANISM="Chlorarachnion reptans, Strain CCCM449" /LENGTH=222 /DNA_ID=CAMNT_0001717761 /DNA_START=93 /DNA_END=762 /DNA_ORIENTATION=-